MAMNKKKEYVFFGTVKDIPIETVQYLLDLLALQSVQKTEQVFLQVWFPSFLKYQFGQ